MLEKHRPVLTRQPFGLGLKFAQAAFRLCRIRRFQRPFNLLAFDFDECKINAMSVAVKTR